MQAANHISYTFNWFYVDNKHIAYFNSGANPVRPKRRRPEPPDVRQEDFPLAGLQPEHRDRGRRATWPQHPHVIDQRYLTSWNNRQAPDYNTGYSSLFRSQLLDERIKPDIAGTKKINLQQLISDMEDAGTVDLRGDRVLPWILKVIDTQPVTDPACGTPSQASPRGSRPAPTASTATATGSTSSSQAIRIMDAWWPRLVAGRVRAHARQGALRNVALVRPRRRRAVTSARPSTRAPTGYVQKDLRDLLGDERQRAVLARLLRRRQARRVPRRAARLAERRAPARLSDAELYPDGPCQLGLDQRQASAQECATRSTTAPSARSPSRGSRGSTGPPSSRPSTSSSRAAREPAISVFTFGGGGTVI